MYHVPFPGLREGIGIEGDEKRGLVTLYIIIVIRVHYYARKII